MGCDAQRRRLDQDIALWYQAYESTMYNVAIQPASRSIIKRVATGPWGAGLWHGDSQQYFLTVWIATSLLDGPSLDYYIYDRFCENPGNQCFVLGIGRCPECVQAGGMKVDPGRCGKQNVWGMVDWLKGQSVDRLYSALANVPGPPGQVFDVVH